MPVTSGTLIKAAEVADGGAEAEVEGEAGGVVVGGAPHAAAASASAASAGTIRRRDMPPEYPRACPPFR